MKKLLSTVLPIRLFFAGVAMLGFTAPISLSPAMSARLCAGNARVLQTTPSPESGSSRAGRSVDPAHRRPPVTSAPCRRPPPPAFPPPSPLRRRAALTGRRWRRPAGSQDAADRRA